MTIKAAVSYFLNTKPFPSPEFIKKTGSLVKKNKTLVGFGISTGEDAKTFAPYCDGVIVGSAIIKSLTTDNNNFSNTIELVQELKRNLK